MREKSIGWIDALKANDYDTIWRRLFDIVSHHHSVRNLLLSRRVPTRQVGEAHRETTQDIFLKLLEKNRWQTYLNEGYEDRNVEHELKHIEIPNFVGMRLRERYPESFRLARRVSVLLQSSARFTCFDRLIGAADGIPAHFPVHTCRIFGLNEWGPNKPRRSPNLFRERIREIPVRLRNIKWAGPGGESQVIISNDELEALIAEILAAIDSPASVRDLRTLVLSKLPIEDPSFNSIDEERWNSLETESFKPMLDLVDTRPTPEELVFIKEAYWQVDSSIPKLMADLLERVNSKPRRFEKLLRIIWHCYFDATSPTQTQVAAMLGISNALVTHYRSIFDEYVRQVSFTRAGWRDFNCILGKYLSEYVSRPPLPPPAPGGESTVRVRRGQRRGVLSLPAMASNSGSAWQAAG